MAKGDDLDDIDPLEAAAFAFGMGELNSFDDVADLGAVLGGIGAFDDDDGDDDEFDDSETDGDEIDYTSYTPKRPSAVSPKPAQSKRPPDPAPPVTLDHEKPQQAEPVIAPPENQPQEPLIEPSVPIVLQEQSRRSEERYTLLIILGLVLLFLAFYFGSKGQSGAQAAAGATLPSGTTGTSFGYQEVSANNEKLKEAQSNYDVDQYDQAQIYFDQVDARLLDGTSYTSYNQLKEELDVLLPFYLARTVPYVGMRESNIEDTMLSYFTTCTIDDTKANEYIYAFSRNTTGEIAFIAKCSNGKVHAVDNRITEADYDALTEVDYVDLIKREAKARVGLLGSYRLHGNEIGILRQLGHIYFDALDETDRSIYCGIEDEYYDRAEIPYYGLSEQYVGKTKLGSYDFVDHSDEALFGETRYYFLLQSSQKVYMYVVCKNGRVTDVTDDSGNQNAWFEVPETAERVSFAGVATTQPSVITEPPASDSTYGSSYGSSSGNSYHYSIPYDYSGGNEEDFYYDNYDDFSDFEEAEEYYYNN